jgi:hypothetical protein
LIIHNLKVEEESFNFIENLKHIKLNKNGAAFKIFHHHLPRRSNPERIFLAGSENCFIDLRKEFQSSKREKEKFSTLIQEIKKSEKFFQINEKKDQKMAKYSEEKVKNIPREIFSF